MRLVSLLLSCVILTSCTPVDDIPEADRNLIYRTSVALLEDVSGVESIPEHNWPRTIARLGPKNLYVTEDGLYIVIKKPFSELFVAETGYFIPRVGWQIAVGHSYELLGNDIYIYKIRK